MKGGNKAMRFFNTAGPVRREDHYCLDPLSRLDLEEILLFIGQKKYFVLHAPRQSGKTSCMLALADYLIFFDRNENTSWEKKIFLREETYHGVKITVWGNVG
jgi:hypothetical protein